jgi:hypothetical protein
MSDVRMSARPGAVAGDMTQFTNTPSSWSRCTIARAVASAPTTTGTTAVCEPAVSNPMDFSPSEKNRAFSQSRSRRSGSRSMISTVARAAATDAGGGAAEKMSVRARCLM